METRAADLAQRWSTVRPTVMVQISSQDASWKPSCPVWRASWHTGGDFIQRCPGKTVLQPVRAEVDGLQGRAESVINSIKGMYDTLQSELGTFKQDSRKWTGC